ncbi:MAG: hypothetical protein ACD_75C01721G0001, partial [uncultured bacterium]
MKGLFPQTDVSFHVLHHHDGIIDHEPHGKHDGQKRQQVNGEAEDLHQKYRADQRQGDGHHRDQHGTEGAEEEEDDHDHDEQGVAQGFEHLLDRVGDVIGGVIGDPRLHARRQIPLDRLHLFTHPLDDIDRVGVGQCPYTDKNRRLPGKPYLGLIILGAELHVGDVAQPNNSAVMLADDQPLEFLHALQVGIGGEIDLGERALGLAEGGEVIASGQGLPHLSRADVVGGH